MRANRRVFIHLLHSLSPSLDGFQTGVRASCRWSRVCPPTWTRSCAQSVKRHQHEWNHVFISVAFAIGTQRNPLTSARFSSVHFISGSVQKLWTIKHIANVTLFQMGYFTAVCLTLLQPLIYSLVRSLTRVVNCPDCRGPGKVNVGRGVRTKDRTSL